MDTGYVVYRPALLGACYNLRAYSYHANTTPPTIRRVRAEFNRWTRPSPSGNKEWSQGKLEEEYDVLLRNLEKLLHDLRREQAEAAEERRCEHALRKLKEQNGTMRKTEGQHVSGLACSLQRTQAWWPSTSESLSVPPEGGKPVLLFILKILHDPSIL